jgi:hypothetical protein
MSARVPRDVFVGYSEGPEGEPGQVQVAKSIAPLAPPKLTLLALPRGLFGLLPKRSGAPS